ncbi:MAG TPA: hypothetical protein VLQ79_10285 [Myxococcaceae bacterium]|nr:hypothetical protein [Myxococcaceae bacterium]
MTQVAIARAPRLSERAFYTGFTVLMAAVVFAGFARTYYLRPLVPAPALVGQLPVTRLIHLHALLFSGWMLLLVTQARLVATRKLALHLRLGAASVALAVLMVCVGTVTALQAVARGVSPPGLDARRFLVVPLFALGVFATLYTAAIVERRNPQAHKRLMLLATIGLLPPALARWLIFYLGLGAPVVLGVTTLFLVPLVVWDLKTRGRLHPATLWGGLFVVLSVPARLAIAFSPAWLGLADRLTSLVTK